MKYPFNVYQTRVEEHIFWIAESPLLNGCVGQGDTLDEAISVLELNEEEWLKTAKEFGIDIPEIPCEPMKEYSGKFTVRCSPAVHRKAVEIAEAQGISLNQYVNDSIVAYNSSISTVNFVMPAVEKAVEKIKLLAYTTTSKSEGVSARKYVYNISESRTFPYATSYAN